MADEEKARIVAEKARETFLKIRELRKTESQFTRSQKDQLEAKIKKLQAGWWEEVKQYMVK